MRSLIIVPAYNEQDNIKKIVNEIKLFGYEYLIINDCSKDNTKEIIENYNHLDLSLNVGLANVTKIGFMYAYDNGYDAAVVIDGDGQHNPKYIKKLLDEIENNNDYVIGSRFLNKPKNKTLRMIGSSLICFFIRLKTGTKVTDPTSGMRALSKNVLADFSRGMNFIAEPDALTYVIQKKYKFKEIQVEMRNRESGESYFKSPLKAVKFMFEIIISILFIQW